MMSFMLYMIMMIPVVFLKNSWLLMQFMYVLLFLYFLLFTNTSIFISKISYFLGVDLFSIGLISMSFLISLLMVISMVKVIHMYMFLFINLTLTFFLYIIFSSLNFLYMYISFEFVLVPLMILILGWGYQPERLLAGLYLFMYTLVVSLPLLGLILFLQITEGSLFFDYIVCDSKFFIIHFVLIIVFMVKLPMFMVHFWLPSAHVQAPVSGSMILAGLMLKIGGYGLIRTMHMYEYMYMTYSYFWYSLSMAGALMIALICLIQGDIKSMIAYSSVSHMGMVVMGLMTMKWWGLIGSYLLMLAHGFCSSGMFYLANLVYMRSSSRSFFLNKGLIIYMPSCSMFYFIYCSFNMSCPPSLNFMSEVMILLSMVHFWSNSVGFFIGISFFCACFSYYLYSYSQHGLNHNLYSFSNVNILEFLGLFMHLLPLLVLPLTLMSMI